MNTFPFKTQIFSPYFDVVPSLKKLQTELFENASNFLDLFITLMWTGEKKGSRKLRHNYSYATC